MREFNVGDNGSFSKTITETDVYLFAGMTGDFNPIHINKPVARQTRFHDRIVHGALVASFISTVLGVYMPGQGTIYLEQNTRFLKPVYIGDTITAYAEITEIDDKKRATVETKIYNDKSEIVVDGYARVQLPE